MKTIQFFSTVPGVAEAFPIVEAKNYKPEWTKSAIKDLVDKELVEIKFCPTQKMIADFFTKPLQGSLFRYFRDFILGLRPISELELS